MCGRSVIDVMDEPHIIRAPELINREIQGFTTCVWLLQTNLERVIRLTVDQFIVNRVEFSVGNGHDPSAAETVILNRKNSNSPVYVTTDLSKAWVLLGFELNSRYMITLSSEFVNGKYNFSLSLPVCDRYNSEFNYIKKYKRQKLHF